jgi:glycosyltransferase involved in cell wall biosynthesis
MQRIMKILFIGPLPEPMTGQSLACQVFINALAKRHAIDLINLSKGGLSQGLDSFGRVIEVVKIIWQTWRKCRDVDVVYFTVSESGAGNAKDLLIFLVCASHLRRMAIHLHGGAGMRRIISEGRPISRALNGFFLKRLGAVIVLGNALKDIYSGFVTPDRLHVIPNFAEDMLFADRAQIASKFEIQRPLKLLFLSNLLPGKGYLELVAAYLSLDLEQQQAVSIDFAGSFEDDLQRDAFLRMIHGKNALNYHGSVRGETKIALFKQSHIFCLPTYYPYEGQPISILEAYASGCAVITTAHSGIPDVFNDRVNGLLVEMRSVESIRSAIVFALASRDLLRNCALHNRDDAEIRYRADRYSASLEGTLNALHTNCSAIGESTESLNHLNSDSESAFSSGGQQDIQPKAGEFRSDPDSFPVYNAKTDKT